MNTDPFVRKALKQFDYDNYKSLDGYTRRVDLNEGFKSVLKFGRPERRYGNVAKSPRFRQSLNYAIAMAKKAFVPNRGFRRLEREDAVWTLNGASSAGFSFPNRKKCEVMEEIEDLGNYMLHCIRDGLHVYVPPTKIAFRGHLSPIDELKVRSVWNYPAEITMIESIFSTDIYQYHKGNTFSPMFYGSDSIKRLTDRLSVTIEQHEEASIDFKGFDYDVPAWLINICFNILKEGFGDFRGRCDNYGNVKPSAKEGPEQSSRVFEFVRSYFIRTRIMLQDGTILKKCNGVPSGSQFTQLIDSMVNYIMITALTHYRQCYIKDLKVLGDDSHFVFRKKTFDLDLFTLDAKRFFGMTVHPKKCKLHKCAPSLDRSFLGYRFNGRLLYRPSYEWFRRILYPERDVVNLKLAASRVLGLYIIGGCNDDKYSRFYRYFFSVYPSVIDADLPTSPDLLRMFKYVFHFDVESMKMPDVRKLHPIFVTTFLTSGVGKIF
jgi:hypothetical protein